MREITKNTAKICLCEEISLIYLILIMIKKKKKTPKKQDQKHRKEPSGVKGNDF